MNDYRLYKFEPLSGKSINRDNLGQIPQVANYRKHFVNIETGVISQITDLQSRKFKRNKYLDNFVKFYEKLYKEQRVSILSFVAMESHYDSISKFLNTINKKLSRKKIEKLGYVWVRDVGDIKAELHFHILLATSRISPQIFNELFSKKTHSNYEVQFAHHPKGLKAYLEKKELYGSKGKRAFGKSREFKTVN